MIHLNTFYLRYKPNSKLFPSIQSQAAPQDFKGFFLNLLINISNKTGLVKAKVTNKLIFIIFFLFQTFYYII